MVEAFLGRHVRGDKILYAVFCSINCLNRKDQNEEIKQVLHGFGFYCSVWQVAKIMNIC